MSKIIDNIKNRFGKKEKQNLTETIPVVSLNDRFSSYPSKGLTPQKLASLLREADDGDVYRQMELFEEMLEKDAHLAALFQARRLAVTRRNYNIIPASENAKDVEIAAAVDKMIKKIRGWKNIVGDILDCVPKGFSVSELMWGLNGEQVAIENIRWRHQKKFRFGKNSDPKADPEELRLIVDPQNIDGFRGFVPDSELSLSASDGISLEENPLLRQRFIVAFCNARSGNPARTSLLRTLTYLFLFKNYDVKWWVKFAEVLLGYRIGKYDGNDDTQKDLLIAAIRGLAEDAAAVISKDSAIEFVEMAGKATSHQVYSEFKDWCNNEMSELVLGHTGSTQSTPGKLGGEDNAKEVKQELVEADAEAADEAITDDIIVPFVLLNFGEQEEYPYYKTDVSPNLDLSKEADVGIKIQQMGGKFKAKTIKERFGWPLANDDEEILTPTPPANSFQSPGTNTTVAADGKKKLLNSR